MATDLRGRWCTSRPRKSSSPRHSRRRASASATCCTGPSSAILSFLGTIVASSNVNASPAPPPFLCPLLDQRPPIPSIYPRSPREHSLNPSDQSGGSAGIARSFPDRFEAGGDGLWRKLDAYTLYGSTVCPSCEETPSGVTAVDDQIQDTVSASSPSSSPSPTYDILDSLPPGWNSQTNASASRTTLILVLSLVLAFIICFVIIGLVFWRKNKRRNHRKGDVEMKARRRRRDIPDDEDREAMVEREIKAKQKIWARATARWKANVRYTARQRRGKRIASISRVTTRQTSVSLGQAESRAASPAPSPSRPLSRRSSIESLYSNPPADDVAHPDAENQEQDQPLLPFPTTPSQRPPSSPPAYHQQVIRTLRSQSIEGPSEDITPSPLPSPHVQHSHLPSGEPTDAGFDTDLHPPLIHAAHVATDDKSLLAHLAELASHPPSSEPVSAEGQSSRPQVSAPVWQDEEYEDFPCDPGGSSSNHTSRPPTPTRLFPPPPPKGKMAEPASYDYYSFEDIEVDAGPSAPPFDDASGTASTDTLVLTPSAPPLSVSSYYLEPRASAPSDWEQENEPTLHSGIGQAESQHRVEISTIPPRPSTDTLASAIFTTHVEGPVANDGTPPSYHP